MVRGGLGSGVDTVIERQPPVPTFLLCVAVLTAARCRSTCFAASTTTAFFSAQGNGQSKEAEAAFLQAARDGDLEKVKLAVKKHKLDPNQCKDVSAGGVCLMTLPTTMWWVVRGVRGGRSSPPESYSWLAM